MGALEPDRSAGEGQRSALEPGRSGGEGQCSALARPGATADGWCRWPLSRWPGRSSGEGRPGASWMAGETVAMLFAAGLPGGAGVCVVCIHNVVRCTLTGAQQGVLIVHTASIVLHLQ